MFALLLLAAAVGLSNFAAAIGIGLSGISGRTRVRVAVVFGLFEAGMPVAGVVLGQNVASGLGQVARWLGAAALIIVGAVSLLQARRKHDSGPGSDPGGDRGLQAPAWRIGRLLISGLALSIDNLAAGFVLGAYRTSLAVAAAVFGVVSVVMSLAGLELGTRLGIVTGERSELIAGAILIAVGAALAAGAL